MSKKRGIIAEKLIEIADIIDRKYPISDQEELFPELEEYLQDLEEEIVEEIQDVIEDHLEDDDEKED